MKTVNQQISNKIEWDRHFFAIADVIASKSRDSSTKVGAVIIGPDKEVRSTGYNGLPRGVQYNAARTEQRPEKYYWFEHAERNAIFNAARIGTPLKGCTIYLTSISKKGKGLSPCPGCTRAIIQSGISSIVMLKNQAESYRTQEYGNRSVVMLREAGINIRYVIID